MEREEIEQLRKTVDCGAVLETSGFAVDVRESTRRAMKFRRASKIIIVTHDGRARAAISQAFLSRAYGGNGPDGRYPGSTSSESRPVLLMIWSKPWA